MYFYRHTRRFLRCVSMALIYNRRFTNSKKIVSRHKTRKVKREKYNNWKTKRRKINDRKSRSQSWLITNKKILWGNDRSHSKVYFDILARSFFFFVASLYNFSDCVYINIVDTCCFSRFSCVVWWRWKQKVSREKFIYWRKKNFLWLENFRGNFGKVWRLAEAINVRSNSRLHEFNWRWNRLKECEVPFWIFVSRERKCQSRFSTNFSDRKSTQNSLERNQTFVALTALCSHMPKIDHKFVNRCIKCGLEAHQQSNLFSLIAGNKKHFLLSRDLSKQITIKLRKV